MRGFFGRGMRRLLVALLFVSAIGIPRVRAQSADWQELEDAILKGDRATATRLFSRIIVAPADGEDPARRSLVETALRPIEERVEGYLAVAEGFPKSDAAVTAVLAALDLCSPSEDGFGIFKDEERPQMDDTVAFLKRVAKILDDIPEGRRRDPRWIEAKRLADDAEKRQFIDRSYCGEILRVNAETPLPLPCPLVEDVRFALYPSDTAIVDDLALRNRIEGLLKEKPVAERVVQAELTRAAMGPVEAGYYVLIARGEKSGRIGARMVVVSDLALTQIADAHGVYVVATFGGKLCAGAEIVLRRNPWSALASGKTGPDGAFECALPTFETADTSLCVTGRFTDPRNGRCHPAEIRWHVPRPIVPPPQITMQVETDRPVYRAGETIAGRVLLRQSDPTPIPSRFGDSGRAPNTSPLRGRRIFIKPVYSNAPDQEIPAETDAFGAAAFTAAIDGAPRNESVSFEVRVPIAADETFADAEDSKTNANRRERCVRLQATSIARLFEFKRPPLMILASAPTTWERGTADPVIAISASLPTGVPAAGIAGAVKVSIFSKTDTVPFRIDDQGRASVRLLLSEMELLDRDFEARVTIEAVASDGEVVREFLPNISLPAAVQPAETIEVRSSAPTSNDDLPEISISSSSDQVLAGVSFKVSIQGPADVPVIVTTAREALFTAQTVVLGKDGSATAEIKTTVDRQPYLYVRAHRADRAARTGRYGYRTKCETLVRLLDPTMPLKVSIARDQDAYRPGAAADWTVRVTDAQRLPVDATVALSVVDERLYRLAAARLVQAIRENDGLLIPGWFFRGTEEYHSIAPADPHLIAGDLFRKGAPIGEIGFGGASPAGGSGGGQLGATEKIVQDREPRRRFRSTAFFEPRLTLKNGVGRVRFTFPDDVAEWRITAVAVDSGRRAARAIDHVATRLPIALELDLPRFLRMGDDAKIAGRVASHEAAARDVNVAVEADGAAITPTSMPVKTEPEAAAAFGFALGRKDVGALKIAAVVEDTFSKEKLDATENDLPVLARSSARPIVMTKRIDGDTAFTAEIPEGATIGDVLVEVLPSLDAFLEQAIRYLADYPYGCAEQTISKLYPIACAFAAKRASAGNALPPSQALSPEAAHRLEVGLARLAELQSRDGGFRWWSRRGDSDLTMTATVFRGLAYLKAAGIEPTLYGIRISRDLRIRSESLTELADDAADETPDTLEWRRRRETAADLCVSLAILDPSDNACIAVADGIVLSAKTHAAGLLSRAGYALALAKHGANAKAALDALFVRIDDLSAGPADITGSVDECEASIYGSMIRLALLVAPDDPRIDRLVAALIRRSNGGRFLHTSGTANAVAALAAVRAARPRKANPGPLAVLVRNGDTVVFESKDLDRTRALRIPLAAGSRQVAVKIAAEESAYATVRFVALEDGKTSPPIRRPLEVVRALNRLRTDRDGKIVRETVDGSVHRGEWLEASLTLRAPELAEHLVIDMPLFAGAEVGASDDAVVADDRVTWGVPGILGDGNFEVRINLRAGVEGRFVWPSAWAETMYDAERFGRSDGREIVVLPPSESASVAEVTALGRAFATNVTAQVEHALDRAIAAANDGPRTSAKLAEVAAALSDGTSIGLRGFNEKLRTNLLERLGTLTTAPDVMIYCAEVFGEDRHEWLSDKGFADFREKTHLSEEAAVKTLTTLLSYANASQIRARAANAATANERRLATLALIAHEWAPLPRADEHPLAALRRVYFDASDLDNESWRAERRFAVTDVITRDYWSGLPSIIESERSRAFGDAVIVGDENRAAVERFFDASADLVVSALEFSRAAEVRERIAMSLTITDFIDRLAWPLIGGLPSPAFLKARARIDHAVAAEARFAMRNIEKIAAAIDDSTSSPRFTRYWTLVSTGLDKNTFSAVACSMITELLDRPHDAGDLARENAIITVIDSIHGKEIDDRLTHLLVSLVIGGPERVRGSAFAELSDDAARHVPESVLISHFTTNDADWAVSAMLERSPASARRCLEFSDLLGGDAIEMLAAHEFDDATLAQVPLTMLSELARGIDPAKDDGYARRERLAKAICASRASDGEILTKLVNSRDPRVRALMAIVASLRGRRDAAFRTDDPGAELYRAMLGARLGNAAAVESVKKTLDAFVPGDSGAAAFELGVNLLRALAPTGDVRALARFGRSAPKALAREIIRAARPAALLELLGDELKKERSSVPDLIAENITREQADALAVRAFEAILADQSAEGIIAKASPAMIAATLPPIEKFSPTSAEMTIEALATADVSVAPLIERFLTHSSLDVCRAAARAVFKMTGLPVRWTFNGTPFMETAHSVFESLDAYRRRRISGARLDEVSPVEPALRLLLLARKGLLTAD